MKKWIIALRNLKTWRKPAESPTFSKWTCSTYLGDAFGGEESNETRSKRSAIRTNSVLTHSLL